MFCLFDMCKRIQDKSELMSMESMKQFKYLKAHFGFNAHFIALKSGGREGGWVGREGRGRRNRGSGSEVDNSIWLSCKVLYDGDCVFKDLVLTCKDLFNAALQFVWLII